MEKVIILPHSSSKILRDILVWDFVLHCSWVFNCWLICYNEVKLITAYTQITTGKNDKGLKLYDPGYINTAPVKSSICYIDGDEGILRYRGYPIEQLAEGSSFVEVAYLLSKTSYRTIRYYSFSVKVTQLLRQIDLVRNFSDWGSFKSELGNYSLYLP